MVLCFSYNFGGARCPNKNRCYTAVPMQPYLVISSTVTYFGFRALQLHYPKIKSFCRQNVQRYTIARALENNTINSIIYVELVSFG
jgi:hypothetical protein